MENYCVISGDSCIYARIKPVITTKEQLAEKYRGLCYHVASKFVKSKTNNQYFKPRLPYASSELRFFPDEQAIGQSPLLMQDVEDLAQMCMVKLLECPAKYWNEHNYICTIMTNACLNHLRDTYTYAKRSRLKEWQPDAVDSESGDWFDTLEGRDGCFHAAQTAFDGDKAKYAMNKLTQAERLVLEFHFGLNGSPELSESRIATRLGRSRTWVQRRLQTGLAEIRKQMEVTA